MGTIISLFGGSIFPYLVGVIGILFAGLSAYVFKLRGDVKGAKAEVAVHVVEKEQLKEENDKLNVVVDMHEALNKTIIEGQSLTQVEKANAQAKFDKNPDIREDLRDWDSPVVDDAGMHK